MLLLERDGSKNAGAGTAESPSARGSAADWRAAASGWFASIFLIIRMGFAPFTVAVADHLGVLGIGFLRRAVLRSQAKTNLRRMLLNKLHLEHRMEVLIAGIG